MVTSGALKLLPPPLANKQRDAITCWMDIVAGTDPTGNPVETYLRVGQDATVVVRVRQTGKIMYRHYKKDMNMKQKRNYIEKNIHNWVVK